MASEVYAAELAYVDPSTGTSATLRYGTVGFVTASTDTPASTFYDGRLLQPSSLARNAFSRGKTTGSSSIEDGAITLNNADGGLDALLDYAFDGRTVTVRRGLPGAAYPSGWTTILVASLEQPTVAGTTLSFVVRSRQMDLDQPLQPVKYAGTNSLPNGLEGVAGDLKGKPKPVCFGSVYNVPAPCVNTSKLIYQVHDGAVASIDAVYDSGVQLAVGLGTWTKVTTDGSASFSDICYGGGLWLAVAAAGKAFTATDPTSWTARDPKFGTTTINACCYGSSLFVAVGNSGKISTSSDGITWTARTSGVATALNDVIYVSSLGLYVAVGSSSVILTSPDGAIWTSRTSAVTANLTGVAFGVGMLVAEGWDVGIVNYIQSSPDGINWTRRDHPFTSTSEQVRTLSFGGGLFLAVSNAQIATSPDGKYWTSRQAGFADVSWPFASTYGLGHWVIVGTGPSSAGAIGQSEDGAIFSLASQVDATLSCIGFGNNQFVVGGSASAGFLYVCAANIAYGSIADLQNDALAPAPGCVGAYLAGGYFRLGAPPAGQVTADVTEGSSAAQRTAGQIAARIFARAGKTTGDWSASDITTLDTKNSAVLGGWFFEETTFAKVLDYFLGTVGAWWAPDLTGIYRAQRLEPPSGTASYSWTANDLLHPLERITVTDEGDGIPSYRTTLRYGKNYTVQDGAGVAGAVTDDRRQFLALEWREATAQDNAVKYFRLLAPQTTEETAFYSAADALTEATRRQVMRGVQRHQYEATLQLNSETDTADLGTIAQLTHPRYSLTSGKLFVVLGVAPNVERRELVVTLWGPSDPTSLTKIPAVTVSGTGVVGHIGSAAVSVPRLRLSATGTVT